MTPDDWSLSDERAFMENLVQQRFNFLLVVYSLVIAGAVSTTSQTKFDIALIIGAVLCTLVSLTVYRAHVKLDQLLIMLHAKPNHPVSIASTKVKELGWRGLFGVAWTIGSLIPFLCSVSLIVAAALALLGILTA